MERNKLEKLLKIPNGPFELYVGKKKLIKKKTLKYKDFINLHLSLFVV